jgi:carboxymethylenebutenolidase
VSGAYIARPTDGVGSGLGVVVGMEMFGVTDHVRDVCDRLAALGHTALAPDFYHRIEDGIELPPDEAGRARGLELAGILTRDDALADVRAAIDECSAPPSRSSRSHPGSPAGCCS